MEYPWLAVALVFATFISPTSSQGTQGDQTLGTYTRAIEISCLPPCVTLVLILLGLWVVTECFFCKGNKRGETEGGESCQMWRDYSLHLEVLYRFAVEIIISIIPLWYVYKYMYNCNIILKSWNFAKKKRCAFTYLVLITAEYFKHFI